MRRAAKRATAAQCYIGVCFKMWQACRRIISRREMVRQRRRDRATGGAYVVGVLSSLNGSWVRRISEAAEWVPRRRSSATGGGVIGMLYETARGVPQNYAEAGDNGYREAAEPVSARQFNLGGLVRTPLAGGVPQDYKRPARWYLAPLNRSAAPNAISVCVTKTGRLWKRSARGSEVVHPRVTPRTTKRRSHNIGFTHAAL